VSRHGSTAFQDTVWTAYLDVESAAGTADAGTVIRHLATASTALVLHQSTTPVFWVRSTGFRPEVTWSTSATKVID